MLSRVPGEQFDLHHLPHCRWDEISTSAVGLCYVDHLRCCFWMRMAQLGRSLEIRARGYSLFPCLPNFQDLVLSLWSEIRRGPCCPWSGRYSNLALTFVFHPNLNSSNGVRTAQPRTWTSLSCRQRSTSLMSKISRVAPHARPDDSLGWKLNKKERSHSWPIVVACIECKLIKGTTTCVKYFVDSA